MTSYNGEKYIRQQLDSICRQTYKDWTLLIRDDGSNDSTIGIIEEYMSNDNRIQLLKNDTTKHGAYLNFWTLIQYARIIQPYDYYFFSDQDDVWLPNKLEMMMAAIDDKKNIPVLAYADMQVIDERGELIYSSLNDVVGLSKIGSYSEFFVHGYVAGCAAVVNQRLFEDVPEFPLESKAVSIMSHDNYYTKFAVTMGDVLYIDSPAIQYRRHGENVTSGNSYRLSIRKILSKASGIFGALAETHGRVYAQTLLTIEQMKHTGICTPDIECIETGIRVGGIKGVRILNKYKVSRKQLSRTIGLYVVMLIGTYKKYMKKFMEQ